MFSCFIVTFFSSQVHLVSQSPFLETHVPFQRLNRGDSRGVQWPQLRKNSPPLTPSCLTFTPTLSPSTPFSFSPTFACGFSRSNRRSQKPVTPLCLPPSLLHHLLLHFLLLHHRHLRRWRHPAAPSPSSPSPLPPVRSCYWGTCPCCSPSSTSSFDSGTRSSPASPSAPARATPRYGVSGSGRGWTGTPSPAPGSGSDCRFGGPASCQQLLGEGGRVKRENC